MVFNRIQALRFFAALFVVAYHAQLMVSSYFPGSDFYSVLQSGQYGVDLFFVISGFIIVYVGSTREVSATVFASRRIQRVVPMYYVATAAVFAMTHLSGMTRGAVPNTSDLLKSLLFASWLNGPGAYPVVNVGWTLEYEMFFYLVFAGSLIISRRPWLAAAGIMFAVVLIGQGQSIFPVNAIVLEFVLGMTICVWITQRRSAFPLIVGIVTVLLILPPGPSRDRVLIYGLSSTGVVAAAVYLDIRKVYNGSILKELGNASYSIYLVHVVTISIACKFLTRWAPHTPSWLTIPFVSLLGIAVGYAAYRLLERPIMKLFSRLRRSPSTISTAPQSQS